MKHKRRRKPLIRTFLSQNVRGLKSPARLTELLDTLRRRPWLAVCLQETWRTGEECFSEEGCTFIGIGLASPVCNRGSQGVGVLLSAEGTKAWEAAGCEQHLLGPRCMAVRLHMQDSAGKNIGLLLVSSYAPVSNASQLEWDNHYSSLEQLMDLKKAGDILLIGADCNASIGGGSGCGSGCGPDTRMSTGVKAVGAYGIAHTNNSGGQLRSFLELNTLVATSTHFRKQSYGTWVSPCSKLPHQLDHVLTHASDFKRVGDAGVKAPLIGSDHVAVCCKLRIHVRLGRKRDLRNEITKLDFAMPQGGGG
jgi:exonuclease III